MKYKPQGSFGYLIYEDGTRIPAAEVSEEESALFVASLLLGIYSSFESKIDDSGQVQFEKDVKDYFDIAFEKRHRYLNIIRIDDTED